MDRILGIDLGTTNSVVAYLEQGQPVVIQNAEGSRTTPSVVLYKSPEEIVVGELAKRQFVNYPRQCIRSVKRFMGLRYSEAIGLMSGIQYNIVPGAGDSVLIDVGWCQVTPEQVSAEILKKMKLTAQDFFGEEVVRSVVTVPAYFNDSQRSATKKAGELAGLDVVRIINEPTAAALAYGIEKRLSQKITIFDLGGGTFDVSVLEVDHDVYEVRSTRGDTFLGGDTFDEALLKNVLDAFEAEYSLDLRKDAQALQRIREAAESVKCELSSTTETVLSLPFITVDESGPLHIQRTLKRDEFEDLIRPLLPRLKECCDSAMQDAQLKPADFDTVLLVGGSTRIPAVQELVREIFGREPGKSLNPDEAVAIGASIQGAILSGGLREVLLLDVTPLSLGIELAGGVFSVLIPRNSSIPTGHTKIFTTVRDNQSNVKVHVLQGERKMATENHSLGIFKLTGIAAAPKEIPAIEVNFQIDANGILHVHATDASSGASSAISIVNYAATSPDMAEETVKAAEGMADRDRAFLKNIFLKNQVTAILSAATQAAVDETYPLDPDLYKSIREAAFRFDVAAAANDETDLEPLFNELKHLSADLSGHIMMANHRRASTTDGDDIL